MIRALIALALLPVVLACSTAHDDFREQAADVVDGFLEAVVAGDADKAASYALIEGDSKYFVVFTEMLAAGELVVHEAELLHLGEISEGAAPHDMDRLTARIDARITRFGVELHRSEYDLGLVGEERKWYIKDVPDDFTDYSQ
ncbi:MAG: hypothetical protein GF403_00510 [Candidatus Coatesbacteria bacterium]|nr:hypothetical protein [Candidatus Coatesbacteria bacterium]